MKKLLLLVSVITVAFFSCSTQENVALFEDEFGVQAFTFRNQFRDSTWTVEAILDTIVALGFTEFETGAPRGISPEDYQKMCAERGLKIISTGASFQELEADPMAVVNKAKAFGASFVMCAWIPHSDSLGFTLEDAQKAVEVFNKAGSVLAENGLTFCYHNHGYEFKPNPGGEGTLMDYILSNTDPANVSFEMDILWTMHGGGSNAPQELLKKYGSRWKLMHVKDLKKGVVGDGTGHTPAENDVVVGTGQANWQEIISLAKEAGIKHYFIEDESENEFVHIPQSIAYLKSLKK